MHSFRLRMNYFCILTTERDKALQILITSFIHPIDYITTKISKLVGVIAKLRHFVPMSTTLNIYNGLILPHITYGINVWGLAAKVHLVFYEL